MKKSILILASVAAMILVGCKEPPYIVSPGVNDPDHPLIPDSVPTVLDPDPSPDPDSIQIPEGTIDVYEAVKIAKGLASGAVTKEEYYIKGWVNGFNEDQRAKTDFAKYGNDFVYISARQDNLTDKLFYCYRIMGPNGKKLPDYETIVIGDFIVIKCKITNYSGIYESSGSCWAILSTNEHFNEVF